MCFYLVKSFGQNLGGTVPYAVTAGIGMPWLVLLQKRPDRNGCSELILPATAITTALATPAATVVAITALIIVPTTIVITTTSVVTTGIVIILTVVIAIATIIIIILAIVIITAIRTTVITS